MTIPVNLTTSNEPSADETQVVYDAWQAVVDGVTRDYQQLLGVPYQTSRDYVGMKTQQVLVTSAWEGIIISLVLATILICIFTGNALIAAIAMFCEYMSRRAVGCARFSSALCRLMKVGGVFA